MSGARVRGNSRTADPRKRQRKVYDTAQLPGVWIPTDGLRALTAIERSWVSMSAEVECIRGATVNTVDNFRIQKSKLTNSTDNSAINVTRYSRQGERGEDPSPTLYFMHGSSTCSSAGCAPSPTSYIVVCEGDWPDLLPGKSVVGLPVVRMQEPWELLQHKR